MNNMDKPPRSFPTGTDPEILGQLRESGWMMTDEHRLALARELSVGLTDSHFPGIDEESKMAFMLPGDNELIVRFQTCGIKVVLINTPGNMEVFILPKDRDDDIVADSIFPRHLDVIPGMDPKLVELILADKQRKQK